MNDLSSNLGALIIIKGYTIAVVSFDNDFYIFDSQSRDSSGKICQSGYSILMHFKTIKDVKNYVCETYSDGSSCFFQTVYNIVLYRSMYSYIDWCFAI